MRRVALVAVPSCLALCLLAADAAVARPALALTVTPGFPRTPVALDVPGHAPAEIVGPASPGPAPLVVVLHGNFDRPEWECEEWERIVQGRAWILCTRGVARKDAPGMDRWTYTSRKAARAEIDAAAAALRARYPGAVAAGPYVYGGFSLGAIYGEAIVRDEAALFPRAVLIEGGLSGWTAASAKAFVKKGGKGVVFGCGSAGCGKRALGKAKLLRAAGATAEVATVPALGHSYGGAFPATARPAFLALVAGAEGW